MKTLLISAASPDTYRNFFFFEGCLFDQIRAGLNRDPELRVVLVVQPKHYEQYKDYENHRVIIEQAHKSRPLSRFQKAFTFLYSYLVYTGTTRTLATMGMRPEDAPGAGKRFLNPLKILIARTAGRIRWIKRVLVPFAYQAMFQEDEYRALIRRYRPHMAFVPHLFSSFDMRLLSAARREGVHTAGMITNWDHFDKYYLPLHVDRLFVQSEQIKRFAIDYQAYQESRIMITGYPYFDFIADRHYMRPRQETLRELGFQEGARYILYVSGSMYCPDEPDVIEEMLSWIDAGEFGHDMHLVIRPYPGVRGKDLEFDEKKFNDFKDHPRVSFYLGRFWGNVSKSTAFMNMVRYADAVAVVYSTAALEALALDRRGVIPSYDGSRIRPFRRSVKRFELREHFKDLLLCADIRKADNSPELRMHLKDAVAGSAVSTKSEGSPCGRVTGPLDTLASKRIFNELMK